MKARCLMRDNVPPNDYDYTYFFIQRCFSLWGTLVDRSSISSQYIMVSLHLHHALPAMCLLLNMSPARAHLKVTVHNGWGHLRGDAWRGR